MNGFDRCERFVAGVMAGKILAPKTIRRACERYQRDKKREDIYLDEAAANAAIANAERMHHVKGIWRGQRVKLEDWQCFLFVNAFGWKRAETGKRRFRYVYIFIPRKNGKSFIADLIALNLFACDGEPGAEVYLGATTRDHARDLLFLPAREIVKSTPKFAKRFGIEAGASSLVIPSTFSVLKSVIRKPDDGYSPHCAVVDEYHLHEDDAQWSTFATGMGARSQPMLVTVTTAGSNLGGPCKEYHDECRKILDGTIEADTTFALIYEPDDTDAWDDPDTLRKVNPNHGVSVHDDYLLDQLEQAKRSAAKQNAFRTKHLNEWVGAKTAWLNMLAWQRQKRAMRLEDFEGQRCQIALDLASKTDLSAMVITFRDGDGYKAFARFYAPEDTVAEVDEYRRFRTSGHLTVTPGAETDYTFIENDLREWLERFDVLNAGADPWQSAYLRQRIARDGMDLYEYRQSLSNMSEPMKETEAAVLNGRLWHDGNPVLTWCVANTMSWLSQDGQLCRPVKQHKDSRQKIDGSVALIMSVGLWLQEPEDSWTANHGVIAL